MSSNVLFILEGEKTENQIVYSLQKFFLNKNTTVKCVYGTEIYQLYEEIVADEDLDTFNLIKERNADNKKALEDYTRDDFAEIYMFFDYDGHSTRADDTKLNELLAFFNEETEKGKLYISYPMVESLKHICDYETFKDLTIECKENIRYKELVARETLKNLINFNRYELATWKQLVGVHLKKMNYITNDTFTLPNELIPQLFIFSRQLEKYIIPHSSVAILSAFPLFLHDYYGNEELKKRIE
jgi:hypothetical protein